MSKQAIDTLAVDGQAILAQPGGEQPVAVRRVSLDQEATDARALWNGLLSRDSPLPRIQTRFSR